MALFDSIIEYTKRNGNKDFEELPFNEVDSLVLCQFSYMKMRGIVPSDEEPNKFIYLSDIAKHPDFDKLFVYEKYASDNRALFDAMLSGRRFNTMKIGMHADRLDEENQEQFSAVTLMFPEGNAYVCFRGTDETFVGWKEDFNMSFSNVVPCQKQAKKYLDRILKNFDGGFYLGGHSKGGNLAEYAAMTSDLNVRDRIIHIFDHDGPGFREDILSQFNKEGLADKTTKLMPHDAVVGMLFTSPMDKYEVVESWGVNVQQHNPFNWRVKNNEFCKTDEIVKPTQFADGTVNRWVLSMDEEQRKTFVDTLFGIIDGSEAKTVGEFMGNLTKSLEGCYNTIKNMDEKTTEVFKETISLLFETAKESAIENINGNLEGVKENINVNLEDVKENINENLEEIKTNFSNNFDKIFSKKC